MLIAHLNLKSNHSSGSGSSSDQTQLVSGWSGATHILVTQCYDSRIVGSNGYTGILISGSVLVYIPIMDYRTHIHKCCSYCIVHISSNLPVTSRTPPASMQAACASQKIILRINNEIPGSSWFKIHRQMDRKISETEDVHQ